MRPCIKFVLLPVVVLLASIALVDRTILFKLPFGFYLNLLTGGGMFMDMNPLVECVDNPEACPWLTSGDVLINVYVKSGNNWMMTLVHEIRTIRAKHLREFDDILEVNPWPNVNYFPGIERKNMHHAWGTKWNNTEFPFKQYKCSGNPSEGSKVLMPVRERRDLKFLVMVRRPEDQMYSLLRFSEVAITPKMSALWGGIPKFSFGSISNMLLVASWVSSQTPFQFFKAWWELKDEPNVLLLHYTKVFENPEKYIRIVADFVGVPDLTEEEVAEISNRVSVDFMKGRNHKYQLMVGENLDIPVITGEKGGRGIVRKGGSSNAQFTEEEREKLHEIGVQSVGKELTRLIEEGFEP